MQKTKELSKIKNFSFLQANFNNNKRYPFFLYLNRVLHGKTSNTFPSQNPMRDSELPNSIISPEAFRAGLPHHFQKLPRSHECLNYHLVIRSDGVPGLANAAGTCQVCERELLEDESESVDVHQSREMGIHWGDGDGRCIREGGGVRRGRKRGRQG